MKIESCIDDVFAKPSYEHPMFKIKKNVNSLNLDYPFPNADRVEKEERLNLLRYFYVKWALIVLIGIAVGAIICAITLVIEELIRMKAEIFVQQLHPLSDNLGHEILVLFSVCCHMISALPVIFWLPESQGIGVPETLSFLNGVDVPGLEEWTNIPARVFSIVFMILGGFPGGQTEALIPVGTVLASTLCMLRIKDFRLFPNHRYDGERRDFGAVGIGAAAAATFGTPVGGAFFAMQQLSTWHSGCTFMIIVGCLSSSFIFNIIYNYYRNVDRKYSTVNSLFNVLSSEGEDYIELIEFPSYVMIAVIGGLLGPLWISVHLQISRFRYKYLSKKLLAVVDITVVGFLISQAWVLIFNYYEHCSKKEAKSKFGQTILNCLEVKSCKGANFNTAALFLLSNPENIAKTILLLGAHEMSLRFMITTFVVTFFASALHLGSPTTSGLFVPNLVMGALVGRIFKECLADWIYKERLERLTEYAYLGALAQVAGVTQFSLAFGVMVIETAGVINFAIPVFLVIFISRYVAGMFGNRFYVHLYIDPSNILNAYQTAYEILCYQKGYAILFRDAPPLCVDLTAKDVMSQRVVCLSLVTNSTVIKNVLKDYQHLEFPVLGSSQLVDSVASEPLGECKGIILRKQLIKLVESRRKESILLKLPGKANSGELFRIPDGVQIDLANYMNVQPYFVHQDMPLTRVYSLFGTLGIHTLLVVDDNNQLIGIITRKDFAGIMVENRLFTSKIVMRKFEESVPNKQTPN